MQKQATAVQNTIKKRIPYFIIVGLILSIGSIAFFFLTKGDSKTSVLVSSDPSSKVTGSIPVTQDALHLSNSKEAREAPLCSTLSPFQSGQVNCREEIKKKPFLKPNTEWKTRTINGITYVLGEGNPKEVALNLKQVEAMTKTCDHDISLNEKGICDPESGLMSYVTPEVEKHLLLALSDPNWSKLATECEKNFRTLEGTDAFGNAQMYPSYLIFDRVFAPGFLDIERFISVDPGTGFKVLDRGLTSSLAQFIQSGMYVGAGRGEPQPNPYGDCVDQYGKSIYMNLRATEILYTRPLMDAEGIIHEVFINH